MVTAPRIFSEGEFYHIYNRSAGKKTIFHTPQDYIRFLTRMQEYKSIIPVKILAYSIMPNHFHLLIQEPFPDPAGHIDPRGLIPLFIHRLCTAYVKYYQTLYQESHSGALFQGRFKSKHIKDNSYLLQLLHYIHNQPKHHEIQLDNFDWPYSSLHDYWHQKKTGLQITDIDSSVLDISEYPALFQQYTEHISLMDEEFLY